MNKYLIFIGICLIVIAGVVYVSGLPAERWIDINQPNHPPIVEIVRQANNESVKIKYFGGWTQSFIDHLMVKSDTFPEKRYEAIPGGVITYPLCPDNTSFEVYVYDRATQHYHLIGSSRV
jgi:hypothetical protein